MSAAPKVDRIRILGTLPNGHSFGERESNGQITATELCPHHEDGQPFLPGREYVHLEKRADGSYDCETLFGGQGPAQVTTENYRAGWDAVWGKDRLDVN